MPANRAKGTRDFLPAEMHDRLHVIETIGRTYRNHGFEPFDTPAFERIETLLGSGGDESDKLVFKILKRGVHAASGEADLALRYDLTVPLARVIAMNPGLRLPFKRYHMGPVWRADRPARGRFREFWQCDVDIIGTTSTLAEAECLTAVSRALAAIGLTGIQMRLNDRRILRALARHLGVEDRESDLLIAVDKLDKIGVDGVNKDLEQRGMGAVCEGLWAILHGDDDPLERLATALADQPETAEAIASLQAVMRDATALGCVADLVVDPTLARGLAYYTGCIWEGVLPGENMGTICSGGRYDGLVDGFASKRPATPTPAVGSSIGLERVLVIRQESGVVPKRTAAPVLVTIFDSETRDLSIDAVRRFREAGIGADLYPDARKLPKQFKHANALGYRFAIVIGSNEKSAGTVQIKDMDSGDSEIVSLDLAIAHVRTSLVG